MKRKRESYTHGPGAPWEEFQVVGKPHPKVDGLDKATGEAIYTDDIQLPGMLHAKTLRSQHPHARIVSIDTSRAEALKGVHAVVTGADMPVKYGVIPWTPDENALATDRVRFVGDEVAAVAAIDEDTANRALDLIDVEYEELPAVFDPEEAMKSGAPRPICWAPWGTPMAFSLQGFEHFCCSLARPGARRVAYGYVFDCAITAAIVRKG